MDIKRSQVAVPEFAQAALEDVRPICGDCELKMTFISPSRAECYICGEMMEFEGSPKGYAIDFTFVVRRLSDAREEREVI